MARSFLKASLTAAAVSLGTTAALAQFNPFSAIFGNPPPPQPQRPPPTARPQPSAPTSIAPPGLPGAVQSQPLPPPPGASANARPQTQERPAFDPVATVPSNDVVVEPLAQKITNTAATFSGLDKITGRIINFDAKVGETVQFGALQLTPRACYTRPATELANTDAFVEVNEITLQGEVRRIFNGWMFAASPGLNAVEHPIYDVWLNNCKGPVIAAAPPPPEPPPAAAAAARPQQPRPQAQPKRPVQQQPAPPPPQQFSPFAR